MNAVFMRIETVQKEEGTYAYLEENMAAVLEASSGGVEPTEVTETASMPSGEGIWKRQSAIRPSGIRTCYRCYFRTR